MSIISMVGEVDGSRNWRHMLREAMGLYCATLSARLAHDCFYGKEPNCDWNGEKCGLQQTQPLIGCKIPHHERASVASPCPSCHNLVNSPGVRRKPEGRGNTLRVSTMSLDGGVVTSRQVVGRTACVDYPFWTWHSGHSLQMYRS